MAPPPPPPGDFTAALSASDLAQTLAVQNAGPISACDPQAITAALAIRQARLSEETMNMAIRHDSAHSEFSEYWTLPDFQSFKFYSGRLAFLAAESQLWARVPRGEFTRCLRYFLQLVQRPPSTDVFSWDIQPSVLVSFCQAIVTVKFPYEKIFTIPGKVWPHNDVIMWQIDSDKFPGPALTALPTGHATYRWWHGCSEASLLGIFKSGRVFRTCNETVGMKHSETPFGFFGRAAFEGDQDSIAAGLASQSLLFMQRLGAVLLYLES